MDIADIADRINPRRAQLAVAAVMAALGSAREWRGDLVSSVDHELRAAWAGTGLPSYSVQSVEAVEFWQCAVDAGAPAEAPDPLTVWADIFGGLDVADDIGGALTCTEAEATAAALRAAGNPKAADTFLTAHLERDTTDGEQHTSIH
ncbi:hypothetical protein [Williamsia muralis]|uniref:Uncharacterized protein n=1 Tax=Williamsia marianensis TaxID=85044 RepID=A0ABU4F0T4_WILMA|nr:hypothetical protein [Williamsia muralis]MDV7137116.1 hypothetical protein [Williamsia muralis]